jgi:cell division protein FtsI/penicillin-binding protein 2
MYKNYVKLRHQLAGKTSTAEIMYNPTLDRESMPIITKDVWFGALSFKDEKTSEINLKQQPEPELVVVVYLRFGDYGKEAAPLASEIITKYRQLCKKYQTLDKSKL